MHEIVSELLAQVRSASRFKWVAIAVAWVICLAGWLFVAQMPDKYQSSAKIQVDTRSILRPLLSGLAIQSNINSQVRLMSKLLFSRPNLEKVARMTDLDLEVNDEKEMRNLIAKLKGMLSISGSRQLDLFTITAKNEDPKLAKELVQSLVTLFVEETLGGSRKDSDAARKFIDQQLEEYEGRLVDAERLREEFKRKNYGSLPGQDGSHYERLQAYTAQLEEAKLSLEEAVNRRNELKRQLEDEEPIFEDFGGGIASSPLDARIQSLQAQADNLLLKYTERHPEIKILQQTIADIERQKEAELESAEGEEYSFGTINQANPVFQQMRISLGEAQATVASLSGRVKSLQKRINAAKGSMSSGLEIETELKGLNRDYAIIKSNYESLLKRRETARLSESVEQKTDAVKFRIIEPPRIPLEPSSPNRIIFHTAVFVGGFSIGLGLIFLLSLLRPVFTSSQKVRDATGLPLLGSVSMNWVPDMVKKRRYRLWRAALASASLLIVFVSVLALEVAGFNLASIFIKLRAIV